jgi:hypothetical protein
MKEILIWQQKLQLEGEQLVKLEKQLLEEQQQLKEHVQQQGKGLLEELQRAEVEVAGLQRVKLVPAEQEAPDL